MTKKKTTKKALLLSALALFVCIAMFIGSTFAWFTDSVTSAGNVIKSGTLKVDLVDENNVSLAGEVIEFKAKDNRAQEEILWEPGCTYEMEPVFVVNKGNLALKYQIVINGIDGDAKLLEAIEWSVKIGNEDDVDLATFEDYLETKDEKSAAIVLVGHMKEEAGNEYQGLKAEGISITVLATQYTHEEDSFNDLYDKDAVYGTSVASVDQLKAAIAEGGEIALMDDITVDSTFTIPANSDVTLNLNGNDLSYAVSNSGASAIINNKGTLEIKGEGTISFKAADPDLGEIPTYATNTITNTGTLIIGKGVTVTNGSEGGASYAVDNHGVFTLNGGTLVGDRCALRVAKYNQDNVVFVMNSGKVEAKTPAWIQLPGSNSNDAPKISVTINGGTFQSTKATSEENNVMYTYSYGNSHANTSITINDGEFLGGTVSIGSGYKGDVPTLKINGGTFEYNVLQWLENDVSQVLYTANK